MKPDIPQSWQDRLAIINEFKLSNSAAVRIFNTTERELVLARGLVQKGALRVASLTPQMKSVWASYVAGNDPVVQTTSVTVIPSSTPSNRPTPAAAVVQQPKMRRGTRIQEAFSSLTTTPVPVEAFVQKYGVSKTVLRQSKRFLTEPIKVSIKRDKVTKQEVIFRVED